MRPSDPLYSSQWHLAQIGNMEWLWNFYSGAGVSVVVYDDGVEALHEDLRGNYVAGGAFTYLGTNFGSAPIDATAGHGTSVAGLIAGQANNGRGGVGVAWGANVASLNFLDEVQYVSFPAVIAAIGAASRFDVMNNSWGFAPLYEDSQSLTWNSDSKLMADAFAEVAANGRGGRGTIIVNAAGNDAANANGEGLLADRHTIVVAAVDRYGDAVDFSNWGANILVTAPMAAYTTDRTGNAGYNASGTLNDTGGADTLANTNYTSTFGGTSAAAPIVSGVVALMLQANPLLGWRDVKNILAASASHTGSSVNGGPGGVEVDGWHISRSGNWNGGGHIFSADYGYGLVDAEAAVSMAEVWTLMHGPSQTSANEVSATGSRTGYLPIGDNATTSASIQVNGNIRVESAQVTINMVHSYAPDLIINLVAPDGSVFRLFRREGDSTLMDTGFTWTFGVEGVRGLDSRGTWQVRIIDNATADTGALSSATLNLFGERLPAHEVHSFTDDFLMMRAIQTGRGTIAATSAGDWLNFAGVSGRVDATLGAGGSVTVGGTLWVRTAAGSSFTHIATGTGSDTVRGSTGADTAHAGIGNDVLFGNLGNDTFYGGFGNDRIYGGGYSDLLYGNEGNDHVAGGDGRDRAFLNQGNDTYIDTVQNDVLGRDTVYGGFGNDTIHGGGGDDLLRGEGDNDSLMGGIGNDSLFGGINDDRMIAGDGNDVVDGGTGRDYALLQLGNDRYLDSAQNDASGSDTAYGGGGNDTIDGGGGADFLFGEDGNDSLIGSEGADRLFGGAGDDTVLGGNGNDTVAGGFGRDIANLGGGNDVYTDTIQNDVNGADTVLGGAGNDYIHTGGGADGLRGEAGNDTLAGGNGADRFIFSPNLGADLVTDFTDNIDTLFLDDLIWGGAAMTAAQVISNFAAVVGGDTVFTFGAGQSITLAGIANANLLVDDLIII